VELSVVRAVEMTHRSRDSLADARAYALRLIGIRSRSKRELNDRLKRRGYPQEIIDSIITHLEHIGLIDDRKFADDIVSIERHKRGRIGIISRMREMGLEQEIIDDAVSSLTDEIEEDAARKVIEKKIKTLKDCDSLTRRRRLWAALKRRGFTQEIIDRVIRELDL